jgi:hypothetical protein
MAKYVRFIRNVDYRHKSRAVTAYKAGTIVYVPDHIASKLPVDDYEIVQKPNGKPTDTGDNDRRRAFLND